MAEVKVARQRYEGGDVIRGMAEGGAVSLRGVATVDLQSGREDLLLVFVQAVRLC